MPDDNSAAESSSTWGVVNIDSTEGADPTEELRVPSSKLPWAICASDVPWDVFCTLTYMQLSRVEVLRSAALCCSLNSSMLSGARTTVRKAS